MPNCCLIEYKGLSLGIRERDSLVSKGIESANSLSYIKTY
jgi:hypothetical protein